jgi:hypothetical protein
MLRFCQLGGCLRGRTSTRSATCATGCSHLTGAELENMSQLKVTFTTVKDPRREPDCSSSSIESFTHRAVGPDDRMIERDCRSACSRVPTTEGSLTSVKTSRRAVNVRRLHSAFLASFASRALGRRAGAARTSARWPQTPEGTEVALVSGDDRGRGRGSAQRVVD